MVAYPGSIASLSNPTGSTLMSASGFQHAQQHATINDEVEAIETELGVNPKGGAASVAARLNAYEAAWTAFTPSFFSGSVSLGSSSVNLGRYTATGKTVRGRISMKLGTGASGGSGAWTINMPVAPFTGGLTGSPSMSSMLCGRFTVNKNGSTAAGDNVIGNVHYYNNGGTYVFVMISEPGSSVGSDYIGSANPWTWAAGDQIWLQFEYEGA